MNVIALGAHPDDCEFYAGGTAVLWASGGCRVRFVSLTNGEAGHQTQSGPGLVRRRREEAAEAARRGGVEYVVLDHPDGRLLPDLAARDEVIAAIRGWNADLVLGHRPNDYHPDHRSAGLLLQDAAFLVTVPHIVPEVPALRANPVFLYFEDSFRKPMPFAPDVAVSIEAVVDRKLAMLDAHVSQFYEWLPWLASDTAPVPPDEGGRYAWLAERWLRRPADAVRAALARWYGAEHASRVEHAEAFEICEYGAQPDAARLRELFPFLP